MTPTCWKWTFFLTQSGCWGAEWARAADQITRVHSLSCPSPAHASCNAAPWRSAWQRLTVSREWCFHWAAAGGRGLIGRLLVIINDVVRNNPNTHWQGSTAQAAAAHSTALDCPVLASALAQHRSQTNPPASLHSTKWRPRARPDQAAAQCPSLPRDTVAQYNVSTFIHTL